MFKHQVINFILAIILVFLISGCDVLAPVSTTTPIPASTITFSHVTPTNVDPTNTPVPTATPTVSMTPTPVWLYQTGEITCPILLYHRIEAPPYPNSIDARYYMPPEDFKWQMQSLKDWGYTAIPMSLLVQAITKGALLPPRPVVISFDDGYESVYQNAYPIMQEFGFTGILYIVEEYIGGQGYMSLDQLIAMTGNGWEIGSHSMSHIHLTANHDLVNFEAGKSKGLLSSEIGVKVTTFAYPYGEIDPFVVDKVAEYGYLAAVGLGDQYINSLSSLYYLWRIEIRNGTDPTAFAALLPWAGKP